MSIVLQDLHKTLTSMVAVAGSLTPLSAEHSVIYIFDSAILQKIMLAKTTRNVLFERKGIP